MIERINHISDRVACSVSRVAQELGTHASRITPHASRYIDKLPKSPNRIVNGVRILIALAVLSPGSCVGVGAAGSWAYGKVNDASAVKDKDNVLSANPDGAKDNGDEIMEWIKKYLPSAGRNDVNSKEGLLSVEK